MEASTAKTSGSVYYQPSEDYCARHEIPSFLVWRSLARCRADNPGAVVDTYYGDTIESRTFADDVPDDEGDHSVASRAAPLVEIRQWLSRSDVTRNPDGRGFVHLVRAAYDPERSGAALSTGRGWSGYDLQRQMKKGSHADFLDPILTLLSDRIARTFNHIAVELLDVTADVAYATPFEGALDELFERHEIQYSDSVPIYWRLAPSDVPRVGIIATRDGTQGDLFT